MAKSAARSPAGKEPAPPQTRRARRRLIGAAALAIAAAIVLTLVLDSEPRGTIREVEVTIPSRNGGNGTSVDAGRAAQPPNAPGAIEGRVGVPIVPPPEEPSTVVPGPVAEPAGPAPSPAGRTAPADSTQADAPTEPVESVGDGEPGAQAPAGQAGDVAAEPPRASGSPAKRRAPGADVAPAPAETRTAGGDDAAERAPAPIRKEQDGQPRSATGSAKAPAAGTKAAVGSKPAARPARVFSVQVGAFSSDESAQAQAQRVRDAGLPVYTEKVLTAQGARIRVRAGPFDNGEEAERARAKLQLSGIESAIIKP